MTEPAPGRPASDRSDRSDAPTARPTDTPGDARPAPPTDAELVALARRDRAAFGPLYDRYVERVYRYCARRLRDREAAEDATSQTFLRALSALDSHRDADPGAASGSGAPGDPGDPAGDGRFAAWLFAIAERVVIDATRRRRPTASLDGLPERAAGDPTPEEAALAAADRDALRALLSHLPPDQRRAIELRLADLTGPEVARVMGRPPGAVKMLQFRAITTLRRLLGADPSRADTTGAGPTDRRGDRP